jgi:hypothetical protein
VILEVETYAEKVATWMSPRTLDQVRSASKSVEADTAVLRKIFQIASIVRYYKIGRNPELWLGKSEELLLAKKFLGMPTLEEQKQILIQKGFLREPGEEG